MNVLRKSIFISLVTIFSLPPHHSFGVSVDLNCNNPVTREEIVQCSFVEVQTAEVSLSVAFKRAQTYIAVIEGHKPEELKGGPEALKNSQRAWIDYRDEHCRTRGFKFSGQAVVQLVVNKCLAKKTLARAKELNKLAEETQ